MVNIMDNDIALDTTYLEKEPKINARDSAKAYLNRKKIEEILERLRLEKELDDYFA